MGGFFGTVSKAECVTDLFYGTDYNSHLGTKRGGLATYALSFPWVWIRFPRNCPEGSAMSFLRQGQVRKPSPGTYALE